MIKMTRDALLLKLKKEGKKVLILRGLPGSGKTTFTEKLEEELGGSVTDGTLFCVCSIDHTFIVEKTGAYSYNPHLLQQAISQCADNFHYYACKKGEKRPRFIVVDNTNTLDSDIEFYLKEAREYRWNVAVITFKCDVDTAVTRNVHKVPIKTINKMSERLKQAPTLPEWAEHIVVEG